MKNYHARVTRTLTLELAKPGDRLTRAKMRRNMRLVRYMTRALMPREV